MKRKLPFLLRATTITACSALPFASLAADSPVPKAEASKSAASKPQAESPRQRQGAAKASDLLGITVKNQQDETLGTVTDLAVDVESGRLVSIILATGIVGQEKTLTAVPPMGWHHDAANKVLHLDTSAEKLASAPKFTMENQEEKPGKVENILSDLPPGRPVAVIVSSGDHPGMADEMSALPPTALRYSKDHASYRLDTTKELLSEAPHFKNTASPDFTQPAYVASMYRAYKMEPYFALGDITQADNSALNEDDKVPAPMNQGNSRADIAITSRIRKEVMAPDGLSLPCKNHKIITNAGKVTFSVPVNSPLKNSPSAKSRTAPPRLSTWATNGKSNPPPSAKNNPAK